MNQEKKTLAYTCLLFESHLWHEEVFPQWVDWLNRLGFYVIICTREKVVNRNSTYWLPGDQHEYRVWIPGTPLNAAGVDLLVVNTLSGYMVPDIRAIPVDDINAITIPTICYIHEPQFWMEKFPVKKAEVYTPEEKGQYHLLRDGTYIFNNGLISPERWSLEGEQFRLSVNEEQISFKPENGRWKAEDRDLWAEFNPDPLDLNEYLEAPNRAAFVCTRHSREIMNTLFPTVDYLMPLYFGAVPQIEDRRHFCISGELDYGRKDYPSLMAAADTLKALQDDKVIIIGGNRNTATIGKNKHEIRLKEEIAEHELEDKIEFTGYLSYKDFFLQLSSSRFILPLVDRNRDGGTYFTKLTGAIAFSIGLAVPMVIDQELAELYGLDFLPTYTNQDLASGIEKAAQIGPEEYQALCDKLIAHRERLSEENFKRLAGFVKTVFPTKELSQ